MKKILTLILFTGVSLFADTYLGGANSSSHCNQIVASYSGFKYSVFGPGYDDNGIYYPYWNACFGRYESGGPQPSSSRYDVYVNPGNDLTRCANDIEWYVANTRCSVAGSYLRCQASTPFLKERIERVACVSRVYSVDMPKVGGTRD